MAHLEARAAEFRHLGDDLGEIVELGRPEKAALGVDQRDADDAEGARQIARTHAERGLEQEPRVPVEEFEEPAVEHDARRGRSGPTR